MRPDQGTEGVDLLVCPTTVLDRLSHNRIGRCNVRRPAPARESDDHADSGHAESEFRRPFQSRLYFGESDREQFRMEPDPTADLQNPLEAAVKERWERYLKEGVHETVDLSFSTMSWASVVSRPLLLSGQLEAWHPTEADSVPPGFTRINRKTPEEQEATRYETPTNSKQSIDEELGIQDVTNITEDWYSRSESELASAVNSVLQPMEVDGALEE